MKVNRGTVRHETASVKCVSGAVPVPLPMNVPHVVRSWAVCRGSTSVFWIGLPFGIAAAARRLASVKRTRKAAAKPGLPPAGARTWPGSADPKPAVFDKCLARCGRAPGRTPRGFSLKISAATCGPHGLGDGRAHRRRYAPRHGAPALGDLFDSLDVIDRRRLSPPYARGTACGTGRFVAVHRRGPGSSRSASIHCAAAAISGATARALATQSTLRPRYPFPGNSTTINPRGILTRPPHSRYMGWQRMAISRRWRGEIDL